MAYLNVNQEIIILPFHVQITIIKYLKSTNVTHIKQPVHVHLLFGQPGKPIAVRGYKTPTMDSKERV